MKAKYKIITLLAVVTIAFGAVTPVFAQESTPPEKPERSEGPFSEYFVSAFAASVGMSVEDVQARMAAGETLTQIAQSLGYDKELMSTVSGEAVAQAVSAGVITQEQADKMANRERVVQREGGRVREGKLLENLGLSGEEMQALMDSGMTIQEVFAQQGVELTAPEGPGGKGGALSEMTGLSHGDIKAAVEAGQTLKDICPDCQPQRTGEGRPNQDN